MKNLWRVLALVFSSRQVSNSLAPGRRTLKRGPGLGPRQENGSAYLATAYCVSPRAELMQRCGARFHAASSVLRVFPATHGFDFHEFVKAEQSTFPAITRLLVATKRAARAKAYAVGFDHA